MDEKKLYWIGLIAGVSYRNMCIGLWAMLSRCIKSFEIDRDTPF